MIYKNWSIQRWVKPIPTRSFDWDAVHSDYDGPGDERSFSTYSLEDALKTIDNWDIEHERFLHD